MCRRLRQESDIPIIMVNASGALTDRVVGLELGADDYVVKPFSVAEVVARIRAVLRRARVMSSAEAKLTIGELSIDGPARRVWRGGQEVELTRREFDLLDEDRIAQVIRNLTRNAIEHTGPGGLVRLTAEARGDRLELAVEDDGPGILETERERIFDRFHRTDGSRSRSLGGSGLGLAIARAIVLAQGGCIWADHSPEGGARIALKLPLFAASNSRVAGRVPPYGI